MKSRSRTNEIQKWKFIIIRDDNGKEVEVIELNDKQKQTTIKTRNKRRKFDRLKAHKKDPKAIKNETIQPQAPKLHFDFQQTVIFSRKSGESEENDYEENPMSCLFEELALASSNGNRDISEISFNDFLIEDCYSSGYISNNGDNDVQVNFYFMDDQDIDEV